MQDESILSTYNPQGLLQQSDTNWVQADNQPWYDIAIFDQYPEYRVHKQKTSPALNFSAVQMPTNAIGQRLCTLPDILRHATNNHHWLHLIFPYHPMRLFF